MVLCIQNEVYKGRAVVKYKIKKRKFSLFFR